MLFVVIPAWAGMTSKSYDELVTRTCITFKPMAKSAVDGQRWSPRMRTQQRRRRHVARHRCAQDERQVLQGRQDDRGTVSHHRRMRKQHAIAASCGGVVGMAGHACMAMIRMRCMYRASIVRRGRHARRHAIHGHRAGDDRHQHDQGHGGQSQPCHEPLLCCAFHYADIPDAAKPGAGSRHDDSNRGERHVARCRATAFCLPPCWWIMPPVLLRKAMQR